MANQAEVAAHLDMTDRHLRRLIQQGVIPNGKGHGGIDIDAARIAYIRYQRALVDGSAKPDIPDTSDDDGDSLERQLTLERLRLTAGMADAQEMKNEVKRQRLVPVDFAVFAFARIASQIGSLLDTVPLKLRRKHPDLEVHHVEALQREIALARNLAAGLGDQLPELINEYFETLDE